MKNAWTALRRAEEKRKAETFSLRATACIFELHELRRAFVAMHGDGTKLLATLMVAADLLTEAVEHGVKARRRKP